MTSERTVNTYVVGDLQGCLDPLRRLLDAVAFDPAQDRLCLLGDLINRGPQTADSLRFARSLGPSCIAILGNHDLSILAQLCASKPPAKLNRSARELAAAADAQELLDWLRCRPLLHQEKSYLLVHAGLAPQWTVGQALDLATELETVLRGPGHPEFFSQMYGDDPGRWSDDLAGISRLRCITNCLTRLRYCTPAGELALAEKQGPTMTGGGLLPWFAVSGRKSRRQNILFGHWSTLGQVFWPQYRVWGLDTGCVWGAGLTALHLESGRLIQAPCRAYKKPGAGKS